MTDLEQKLAWYSNKDLNEKKTWYASVAEAYHQTRPRYPEEMIRRVVERSHLPQEARILELGCGPGTATIAFASLGFSILGLEPSPATYKLAQQNCAAYASVTLQNTAFEEWPLAAGAFDAVLSATAFHWISPEIRHAKAAAALRDNAPLILLWNTEAQPSQQVRQELEAVYQKYAPTVQRYEPPEEREKSLGQLGQSVIDSGYFEGLIAEEQVGELTYCADQYITLLGTYSPYIQLEPSERANLFAALREKIVQQFDGILQLSYISVFQIAWKKGSGPALG